MLYDPDYDRNNILKKKFPENTLSVSFSEFILYIFIFTANEKLIPPTEPPITTPQKTTPKLAPTVNVKPTNSPTKLPTAKPVATQEILQTTAQPASPTTKTTETTTTTPATTTQTTKATTSSVATTTTLVPSLQSTSSTTAQTPTSPITKTSTTTTTTTTTTRRPPDGGDIAPGPPGSKKSLEKLLEIRHPPGFDLSHIKDKVRKTLAEYVLSEMTQREKNYRKKEKVERKHKHILHSPIDK